MNYLWQIHLIYGIGLFVVGTVVGSFLNVCIYRIPWEKSVIWPGSHCPHCLAEIEARDNVPVLGWAMLRGACRSCHSPISIRYPLVEFLVGLLFLAVYLVDGVLPPEYVRDDVALFAKVVYHALFVALLIAVTFIDADLTIVPASVTNTGDHPRPGDRRGCSRGVRLVPARDADRRTWGGLWRRPARA